MPNFILPPLEIFAIEAIFSGVIFITSFVIYYRVHELYKLTDYPGLHYFSNTFLFLGLAYFLRFLVFIFIYSQPEIGFERVRFEDFRGVMVFSIAFMSYSSSASILYLIYSITWRLSKLLRNEALLHSLALVFAVISVFRIASFLLIQLALLVLLLIAIAFSYKKLEAEKKTTNITIYPLYALIFVFWVLNLLVSFRMILPEFRFVIYALSIIVLLIIAYRILKRI
ncbi:MAG: hypothetical protein QXU31_08265 [Archaeoglobaceae archaeon]